MKNALKFSHALRAIIHRFSIRHKQQTGQALSLHQIAQDVDIPLTILARALRGESILDSSSLLPLFIYLGCDEVEQRFLYHLAEFTLPGGVESITDEQAATLFALQPTTDPALERITEKHSVQ